VIAKEINVLQLAKGYTAEADVYTKSIEVWKSAVGSLYDFLHLLKFCADNFSFQNGEEYDKSNPKLTRSNESLGQVTLRFNSNKSELMQIKCSITSAGKTLEPTFELCVLQETKGKPGSLSVLL